MYTLISRSCQTSMSELLNHKYSYLFIARQIKIYWIDDILTGVTGMTISHLQYYIKAAPSPPPFIVLSPLFHQTCPSYPSCQPLRSPPNSFKPSCRTWLRQPLPSPHCPSLLHCSCRSFLQCSSQLLRRLSC